MKHLEEIQNACQKLGIGFHALDGLDAQELINQVLAHYLVKKNSGHISIGHDSISIPLEPNEFTFSQRLPSEPAFLFFDQENHHRNQIAIIEDGSRIGEVMENSYGMEYFVTNESQSYLLAVNWYVIEAAGEAKQWFGNLEEPMC